MLKHTVPLVRVSSITPRLTYSGLSTMTVHMNAVPNKNDLLSALRNTGIIVPPRIERRTTSDTEIYSICHLLSALALADKLTFPFSVRQQDKPDALSVRATLRLDWK
jgi:hypothetical protein